VNRTLQTLIKLQEVDKVILDDRQTIEEYPEKIRQLDDLLNDGEQKIAGLKANIDEQEKIRRSKEHEIESNVAHVAKYQGQLTQVKTNKEYSALLAEITGLKNKNTLSEDDILELMESVERAKQALGAAKEELEQTQLRVRDEKQRKELERQELQTELEARQKVRDQLAQDVEKSVLKEYDKMLNLRHGFAIAPVGEEGICSGCRVALTPQMFTEIRTGEFLHRCPICFRYVYWNELDGSNAEV